MGYKMSFKFIPVTPAGTVCFWLEADTEEKAWENLMEDARHMPYKDKGAFVKRGYKVDEFSGELND